MPVLVAAVVGGLLVLAGYAGGGVLALAVIGAQVVLAYGLTGARNLPDHVRSGVLIAASGAGVVFAFELADPDPTGPTIAPVLWVLGPAVVLALLLQLTRRDGRQRLVESLATTVTGSALAGLLALLVPLADLEPLRQDAVALTVAAALVGACVWWLAATPIRRLPRWVGPVLAVAVLGAAVVALSVADIPGLSPDEQLVIGVATAVTGLIGAGTGRQLGENAVSRAALLPTLSLALSAPAGYLAVRLLFW